MNAQTQPMTTPAGAIPRMAIGRHTDFAARREADYEVTNLAVRTSDRAAFLGIIKAREDQLAAPIKPPRNQAIAATEIASFALAAKEAIETDCPPELVDAHLQTAAARLVALLADRQEGGRDYRAGRTAFRHHRKDHRTGAHDD